MNYRTRDGIEHIETTSQDELLKKLYGSAIGRFSLKILTQPVLSKIAGKFLDSSLSKFLIEPFLNSNNIDRNQYIMEGFECFNDCFTRQIKEGMREIDITPNHLISPCDCKVLSYDIEPDATFIIKNTKYTVASLLKDKKLAERYKQGNITILRLSVDDYHRYCYIDDGCKTSNRFISGILHTVNPIATEYAKIYAENSREYTLLHTKNFGDVIQIEVGALLVGRIKNHHNKHRFKRGEEKGMFEYGGSTIVLITNKDNVKIDTDILENTALGVETKVKMGERIGCNYSQNHSLTNS
ncbi:MAG: phosphatidylserine decarboxylase [Lachnospiraceae bacterium]|nr:phosphatidylserine decarboxylase [Lachnospiraceae bacterium]